MTTSSISILEIHNLLTHLPHCQLLTRFQSEGGTDSQYSSSEYSSGQDSVDNEAWRCDCPKLVTKTMRSRPVPVATKTNDESKPAPVGPHKHAHHLPPPHGQPRSNVTGPDGHSEGPAKLQHESRAPTGGLGVAALRNPHPPSMGELDFADAHEPDPDPGMEDGGFGHYVQEDGGSMSPGGPGGIWGGITRVVAGASPYQLGGAVSASGLPLGMANSSSKQMEDLMLFPLDMDS